MPLDKRWAHQPESSQDPRFVKGLREGTMKRVCGQERMSCIATALSKARLGNRGAKALNPAMDKPHRRGGGRGARKKGTRMKTFKKKAGKTKLGI